MIELERKMGWMDSTNWRVGGSEFQGTSDQGVQAGRAGQLRYLVEVC